MKLGTVPSLNPELEALLASERKRPPEPEQFRARALARARATRAHAPLASVAAPRPRRSAAVALVAVLAVAGVAAAALEVGRRLSSQPASALASDQNGKVARPLQEPRVARPANAPVPSAAEPSLAVESAAKAEEPAPGRSGAVPDARRDVPDSRRGTKSEQALRELELLRPARAAVARGDYSAALLAVNQHAREFRNGQLSEEREALRVRALSGLNRTDEATRAAAAFRKRFPGSVLLSGMKQLGEAKP